MIATEALKATSLQIIDKLVSAENFVTAWQLLNTNTQSNERRRGAEVLITSAVYTV